MFTSSQPMRLHAQSIRPKRCSATDWEFCPAAFATSMPRSVAAGMSTLFTPTPARAIILNRGAPSITSLVYGSAPAMTAVTSGRLAMTSSSGM